MKEPIKEEQYAIDGDLYNTPAAPIDGYKGTGISSATVAEWDVASAKTSAKQSPKKKAPPPTHDVVNSPSHYTQGKWEVIEVLEEFFPQDPLLFNVGKYLLRHNHKGNPLTDLRKAAWYLERRIKQLEAK